MRIHARLLVLSSLVATATGVMVVAGPGPLVPAPESPVRVGVGPSNIAIGDVNNDRIPDVVVTNAQRRISVRLGQGDGRFSLAPISALDVPENASELALGDVNSLFWTPLMSSTRCDWRCRSAVMLTRRRRSPEGSLKRFTDECPR